jgi:hypothetical protein
MIAPTVINNVPPSKPRIAIWSSLSLGRPALICDVLIILGFGDAAINPPRHRAK